MGKVWPLSRNFACGFALPWPDILANFGERALGEALTCWCEASPETPVAVRTFAGSRNHRLVDSLTVAMVSGLIEQVSLSMGHV